VPLRSILWHNRGIRKEVLGIKGQGLPEGATKLKNARSCSVGYNGKKVKTWQAEERTGI
jgi:hypothetical protein